ncbi:hypothetical protein pdam_00022980 [Pocillopora damicornis]|uniref:Uncharacterized protein n=1 Tax=Pocillopora damicornis TaxID=46731 RepID=A0A3M6TRK5_POCDA|nr:hypothetical protein pdam_00022980 [Pocillopora damicornis]
MEEIKYLEQATLEFCSTSSKGSNRSKISKQSGRSTTNSESQTKIDKYELQKEKAALKVKIAFAKQERELKLAKLNVCEETKRTQTPSLNEDFDTLPCEGEEEGLERSFKGLPTPTGAHATCTLARAQVTQTSAVTTTASNLRISAPVSSPVSNPVQVTSTFSTPSVSPVATTASSLFDQGIYPQGQTTSPNSGLERVASSLERCLERLAEVNVQQSTVNKQLFVSGQLSKINIPIFGGDPLQYPAWNSAFNALVDSRPMEADIKLNMLNQDAIKQWRHTHDEAGYATFSKFASFIREAADKANIPELESLSNSSIRQRPDRNKGRSLATSAVGHGNREADSSSASKQSHSGPAKVNNCLFCGAVHKLEDCSDYCKKPFNEKKTSSSKNVCAWDVQPVAVTK